MATPRSDVRLAVVASGLVAVGCALAGLAHSLAVPPLLAVPWWLLVVLVGLLESRHVYLSLGRRSLGFTLSDVALVLCLASQPALVVPVVMVLGSAPVLVLAGTRGIKLLYNLALIAVTAAAAVAVHRAVLWGAGPAQPRGWLAALLATLLAAWLSLLLISLAVRLSTGTSPLRELLPEVRTAAVVTPTLASFTLVAVVLLDSAPVAVVLLVAPLALAAWSYAGWRRLRETSAGTDALYRFTRSLGTTTGVSECAAVVLHQARDLLHAQRAELVLLDGSGGRRLCLEDGTSEFVPEDLVRWSSLAWAAGATAATLRVAEHDTGAVVERLRSSAGGAPVLMASPLLHEGQVLGALLVAGRTGPVERFRREEQGLFEALAGHAAVALLAARMVDELRGEAARREVEALHDSLTGLRNRRAFTADLEAALQPGTAPFAVAVLDLDIFKEVNDTLGHLTGDRLLQEVARRLRESATCEEVVARLGGDEFAVLVPGIRTEDESTAAVHRVLESLRLPVSLEGVRLAASVTAGVTLSEAAGDGPETLLRRADVALYVAKRRGTSLEVYRRSDDLTSRRRLDLLAELPRALDGEEISVWYQPKARTSDRRVVGLEALARWDSPTFGEVEPSEFVPLAEANGQLRRLTALVLLTALEDLAGWRETGLDVGVAVNISTRALLDEDFPEDVARVLAAAGVPPSTLTLEITEGTVMRELGRSVAVLERLDRLGVRLAVDDFGTGWSSLSYLTRLPVDEVKIDKSFVATMTSDPADAAVVSSTVGLAHELGMVVVAEGVEDPVVWDRLRALGCDEVQGFLVHRPAPAAVIGPWLSAARARPGVDGPSVGATERHLGVVRDARGA